MILPVSNPGKTRLNCRNQFQLKYGLASRLPTLSGRTIGTVIFSNGHVGTDCLHVAHGIADFSNREADKRREVPFLERKASCIPACAVACCSRCCQFKTSDADGGVQSWTWELAKNFVRFGPVFHRARMKICPFSKREPKGQTPKLFSIYKRVGNGVPGLRCGPWTKGPKMRPEGR